MGRKIFDKMVIHRDYHGWKRVCESCRTPLKDGEFFHTRKMKVYHVNKEVCRKNKKG